MGQSQGYYGQEFYGDESFYSVKSDEYEEEVIYGKRPNSYQFEQSPDINRNVFTERKIGLKDNLHLLRDKANFVSLAIWQQVFDLQEHWDSSVHDASIFLIQLCAPKDSVLHFHKMK